MGQNSAHLRQWTAASIASMSLLMTGMFLGWPSPTISKLHAGKTPLALTGTEVSWMVSLLYVGSVISPLPGGVLMDRWGRHASLRACSILALASWLLLAFRTDVISLYISRILGGMWGGISYCITPVYLCEIAEPRIRGALNTVFTLMVYLGIMFEYCIGPFIPYTLLSLLSACVPLLYFLLMFTIPESPYFFVMKDKTREAREALLWLRCTEEVEEELEAISKAVASDMKNKGRVQDLVRTPAARRALFMTEVAAFLQRMSGSSVMMAYISSSVPQNGALSGDQCAVVLCCLWLVFGVWSTFLVDRLGRRPLLGFSCIGCTLATGGLTVWFLLTSDPSLDLNSYKIVPLVCFALYALFFPFGLACIPSILQGELFPTNLKGLASGITAIVVAALSFISNKLYQPLSETWGTYTNYLYFTVCSAYGIYFALGTLLETRNKTLQEIQQEL
uniref:Major facilitator superfamily (MFS) profile domain-containing protein n=2 Tax=Graphocephala atropunctata TaxID=36148 RepID=A0A1B6M492_9HEMI